MNDIFNVCVEILEYAARFLNMTYEEVNVWLFCIIEPLIFLAMLAYIIHIRRKLKRVLNLNASLRGEE